ncbi:transcription activator acu-15 [Purpureocillium lavendulum]|uniref:Transcription activator acu-15 n=1 Tax=Purpureocillium lavendulum TaxID=1247861 RepID=A0AB34FYX6_9HYPO|nr:transcription activator acu-15 [Purpureocillium lavendulum]
MGSGDRSSSNQQAAVQSGAKPRTRQRVYKAPPPLDVPDIDDDAAERKRVLNVLAQRRYREKKRLRRLGKDGQPAKSSASKDTEEPQASPEELPDGLVEETIETVSSSSPLDSNAGGVAIGIGVDLGLASWDPLNDLAMSSILPDAESLPGFMTDEASADEAFSHSNFNAASINMSDMFPAVFSASPSSFDATSSASSSDSNFPDSYLLPVHELTLLRAMLRIATRIGCKEQLWSLDALSPFNRGNATPLEQLPAAWRPTPSQVLVPHHPLLDFLPWPGVRDRIIGIMSLPDDARPPNAVGPLALVNFAYDFEDNAEGVRIYGGDPYDPDCWEVGQVLFERWWFIFDRNVIDNSNRWRRLRGAPPLALKGAGAGEAPAGGLGAAMSL